MACGHDPRLTILNAVEFAREFVIGSCLDERGRVKTMVVVEELVSNLMRHGGRERDIAMSVAIADIENGVSLALEDDGAAFDPINDTQFEGVDPVTGGGIGLAIVRAWGKEIAYSRVADQNQLRLVIR